jgi:hypothetical protein
MSQSLLELIEQFTCDHIGELNFSFASVASIDFQTQSFETKSFYLPEFQLISNDLIFDLASLTKPLTLGLARLHSPNLFDKELDLLINHRAGLPAFGALSSNSWRSYIESFDIKENETLYSDYSALRTMLEFEKKSEKSLKEICDEFYTDIKYWLDLSEDEKGQCAITGERFRDLIQGQVHDPNAYNINSFCSHAGYFGTIKGLAKSILKLDKSYQLLKTISAQINSQHRFVNGFDRVTDMEQTLAGKGCGKNTFGHLGFTGTCFWIDPDKKRGWSFLTNATENFWFERKFLNGLRREIGKAIWSGMGL